MQRLLVSLLRRSGTGGLLLGFLPFGLGGFRSGRGHVVVIGLNHHHFAYVHRDVEPVSIFYQYNVFTLKSGDLSATNFAQKANFISYFYHVFSV